MNATLATFVGRPFQCRHGGPKRVALLMAIAIGVVSTVASAAETTLIDAAERGEHAAALRLLSKGANPNLAGSDGTTAIMWAASNGDVELRICHRSRVYIKLDNDGAN